MLKLPKSDDETDDKVDVFEALSVQYRPRSFDEMYGNEKVVASIMKGLKGNRPPRSYLFTGPSGCGKTTTARIIAQYHKIPSHNIVEIDAATYSSIDSMRKITETIKFVGKGANRRMIIVDECHGLSKSAWQALLKPIEESQEGLYWAFCTTEEHKVPATIKTRCQTYALKALSMEELRDLVGEINEIEQLGCSKNVLEVVVANAGGSPRLALQRLEQVRGLEDEDEAAEIIDRIVASVPTIELIRLIVSKQGFTWARAKALLQVLEDQDPESTRLIFLDYCSKALLNSKSDKSAPWLLTCLDAFSKPFYSSEKMAPLLLAIGTLCFGQQED